MSYDWEDCAACKGDPRVKGRHHPDCRRSRSVVVRPIPVGIQGAGIFVDAGVEENAADLAAMMAARRDFVERAEAAIESGDSSDFLARLDRYIDTGSG